MLNVTLGITENVKTFPVMCLTCLSDRQNDTVHIVNKYILTDYYDFRIRLAEY